MFKNLFTKNVFSKNRIIEEYIYELVGKELLIGEIRTGLWTKAISMAGGSDSKAEAIYIKLRAQSIVDKAKIANENVELSKKLKPLVSKKVNSHQQEHDAKKANSKQQSQLESQLIVAIHKQDYNQAHDAIVRGLKVKSWEYANKCHYLMEKCSDQDLNKLILFFLKKNGFT